MRRDRYKILELSEPSGNSGLLVPSSPLCKPGETESQREEMTPWSQGTMESSPPGSRPLGFSPSVLPASDLRWSLIFADLSC